MPLTASQSGHGLTHRRLLSGSSSSSESATKSQYLQRRDPLKVVSPVAGKQNLPLQPSSPPLQQKLQRRTSSLNHLHSPQSPPAPGRSNLPRRERNLSGTSVTATTTFEPKSPHHVPKLHGSKNVSREPSIPRSRHESISHGASVIQSTTATVSGTTIAGTLPAPTVSTSTTFYSGVKLAPPVKSASVEGVERRTSDQKIWYTIQVYPYDLTIPSCANGGNSETARAGGVRGGDGAKRVGRDLKTNSITRPADTATGSSSGSAGMSFSRKPYKIYRRYEDVADFADQLEEELPRLLEAAKAASAAKTTKSRLPSASASVTASSTTSTLREQKGDLGTAIITNSPSRRSPRGSTLVSPLGPAGSNTRAGVRDNASLASGSQKGNPTMAIKPSRTSKCADTSTNMNAQATRINAGGTVGEGPSTSLPEISLPRLKSSGLVLFVTKTVCLQRKSELDRYLQELFSSDAVGHGLLGPIIAHSRLVAEFFGIWKTDMEAHLRQEDCDPLALHSVAIPPSTPSTTGTSANRTSTSVDITAGTAVSISTLSVSHEEQLKEEDRNAGNRALTVLSFDNRDPSPQIHPTVARSPPSPHSSDPCKKEDSTARKISASSFPSVPTSIHPPSRYPAHSRTISTLTSAESPQKQHQNVETTMHLSYPSTNGTSPSLVALSPRQLRSSPRSMGRTAESTAQPVGSTAQWQQQQHGPPIIRSPLNILDSDMASPTKVANCAVIQDDVIHPLATTTASVAASNQEWKTVSNVDEDPVVDITVRTIKKFKSLGRIQTPGLSGTHPQHHHQQQDAKIQGLEGSSPASDVATLESIIVPQEVISPQLRPVVTASSHGQAPPLQAGLPISNLMKQSKTIVFRPEVAMQPLSSKNVIPPWNRIPAVAGISTGNLGISTSSPTSPRSPDSPRTPRCGSTYGINTLGSPGTVIGESVTATTPTTRDPEERPRKLAMSHSKTIPEISSSSSPRGGLSSPSATSTSTSGPQSSSSLALTSPNIGNGNPNNGTMNSTMFGQRSSSRSMSISSVSSSSNSTLIAPWNRVHPNAEPNTHPHSLVKLNGGSSCSTSGHQVPPPSSNSNSTYIPVDGKSYLKKEGLQKSYTIATTRGYSSVKMDRGRSTPVLTLIPEGKSKESVHIASEGATRSGKSERSGMMHSVSAPGGFLPTTTAATADISQTSKIATSLIKRALRRESATSLHSPSMSKQPMGILKHSSRKGSLTVPGTGIFPVQPPSPTSPTSMIGHRHGSSVATTFKIVMDADTIVALQVFEDKDFVLTLDELQKRVKSKLLKSNIQLPNTFDLTWMMPSSTSSSGSNTPMMTPSAPSSPGFASSTFIHSQSGPGVILKTEEDLQRAIHSSRNHKVTLRCTM